jgi:3-polyprenyl-4-hydroxybenzoate decarboxylase
LRIVVAITGASGVIYTQRLLDNIDTAQHELHVVMSNYAHQVIADELPGGLRLPPNVKTHGLKRHERAVREREQSIRCDGHHSLHGPERLDASRTESATTFCSAPPT